jgi:Asp-tRNA(Asn)/Glu-tRNA(Gln) amidotransferase B subunit
VEAIADLFEATVALGSRPRAVAAAIVNDLLPELKTHGINELALGAPQLHAALALVEDGTVSSSGGKVVIAELAREGGDPLEIVERRSLRQLSDPAAIQPIVDAVVAANPAKAEEYRAGRAALIGFFIGQVMRETGGRANPELVRELIERRLAER